MTLAFLALPADERKVYIDEAAARLGVAPAVVEKDFWVCWLLGLLFEASFRDTIGAAKLLRSICTARSGRRQPVSTPNAIGLRRDYQAMRDMYLAEPRPFEEILASLVDVERPVNGEPAQ